ncbi:MAG: DNA polymerase III subunit chi [Hyphomonadaceae bacterium]|nr:MAG: DNA polymerase III subunit chi [Caulobacteraceae bacterium]MBT9445153.1 DNA polymerase III subunit chi [Hyphomonadaceae bacterium]TPW02419.1 MAG: DNA polymerase III subunit chi [Alphaproteobacteria bacterium]
MSSLWFYHLERSSLEAALAPLLEKCLQRGWRAVVRGPIEERLDALDEALWTVREDGFLPHARSNRGAPEKQPILLTSERSAPNGAKALFLVDGADPGVIDAFERASVMFDGRDEAAVVHARLQWKAAKDSGHDVAYWKETGAGRWEKQA